jgi:methylthioribose-1-phosphate isomerase
MDMKVKTNGSTKEFRTVWLDGTVIRMIDQSKLPFHFRIIEAKTCNEIAEAIQRMTIRGTLAIGAAGAFSIAQTCLKYEGDSLQELKDLAESCAKRIISTRPTGVDLARKVTRVLDIVRGATDLQSAVNLSVIEAQRVADEDVEVCKKIGENGSDLLGEECRVLTHCNTGLGAVDYGTALGVIRRVNDQGKKITVYVTETRPWSQGARLTTWEMLNEGIPHYLITDASAGMLMHRGEIDVCIVGADRIARNGDTANKVGTYQLAVLAKENRIPFYVATPLSTFDLSVETGDEIPLEERDQEEVLFSPLGLTLNGEVSTVRIAPEESKARNFVFDITPHNYITAFITERGVVREPYRKNIMKSLEN